MTCHSPNRTIQQRLAALHTEFRDPIHSCGRKHRLDHHVLAHFGQRLWDGIDRGSAFGVDTLVVNAEGSLPEALLLSDTLDFGSVSVNSYATEFLPMASVGIGSLYGTALCRPTL